MSRCYPDCWVVIRLLEYDADEEGPIFKILAGWYGGYTTGDSWKLNSGITKITEYDHYYDVEGYSGSVYRCNKHSERMSGFTSAIFEDLRKKADKVGVGAEIVSMETALKAF